MRKQLSLTLAAAMACGGIGLFASSARAADDMNDNANQAVNAADNAVNNAANDMSNKASNAMASPTLPPGVKAADTPKKDNMTETLKEATEATVTKGGFDTLIRRFVDQDRDRMDKQKEDKDESKKLDGRIEALQKSFKAKYGDDFNIEDKSTVFKNARAVEGEITDPAALMKHWPVKATPGHKAVAELKADVTEKAGSDETEDNANIEKGREIGVVRLQAENGLPAVDVSMIDEAGGWKIDVPNNRSYSQIRADLLTHLTYLDENKDKWPDDVNQAYRLFVHHMAMAVYGVAATGS